MTRTRRVAPRPKPGLSPEAKREIGAVVLGLLALLLLLGCIGVGGALVVGLFRDTRVLLGFAAYLSPIALAALSWMLFASEKYAVGGRNYVGFIVLLASVAGLFAVGQPAE